MLIAALNDFYDILASNGKLLPQGYSGVKIHYLIELTEDGEIGAITNCQSEETRIVGKKEKVVMVPREMLLPLRTQKTGIDGNYIEHRPLYIFGLNYENDELTPEDKTDKAKKSHDIFVKANLEFIDGIDTEIVNAYRMFLESFIPENETMNPYILEIGKNYKTSNFAFCLSGRPDVLLHEELELKQRWNQIIQLKEEEQKEELVQCAISGEKASIARIHNKIKGFNAMGSALIGYNDDAFCSYGNEQAYNSNISQNAMERYTESLNYLLANKAHKTMLDGTTIIYFAMDKDQTCTDMFNLCMFEESGMDAESTQNLLDSIMKEAIGMGVSEERINVLDKIDTDTTFYMFGLRPNSSRLALKFIYREKFADILHNMAMHQNDLRLSEESRTIPLWKIMNELKPTTNRKVENDPALMEKMLYAIVHDYNYPNALLYGMVRRIKTDPDTDMFKKINSTRVAIIKACINRQQRLGSKREEIKMALDNENANEAYLCGRLFAVLEKLQQDASGGKLNRTIKDSYFASACSTPAIVFPKLLRLAQNHIPKATYGKHMNYEMGQIMNLLEGEFPVTLNLVDQGKFIVGYYQQYYKKYNDKDQTQEEGGE